MKGEGGVSTIFVLYRAWNPSDRDGRRGGHSTNTAFR